MESALHRPTGMDGALRGPDTAADPLQPLRDDVRLLGELLGRVLQFHGGDGPDGPDTTGAAGAAVSRV